VVATARVVGDSVTSNKWSELGRIVGFIVIGGSVIGGVVGVSEFGAGEGREDGSGAGQSLVQIALSLQYVPPDPQKPYWLRQWPFSLHLSPPHGPYVG